LKTSMLSLLPEKWSVKAVRRVLVEARDVMSATTPRMIGPLLSVEA
jgi:hypothetical protein